MSSAPSTPLSSASSSTHFASELLTPGQKVQALLAQFDDSDLDASPKPTRTTNVDIPKQGQDIVPLPHTSPPHPGLAVSKDDDDDDDDDDNDDPTPLARRGRLAARLEYPTSRDGQEFNTLEPPGGSAATFTAQPSCSPQHMENKEATFDSSDDELSRPVPTRRLLLKRKRSDTSSMLSSTERPRNEPPAFSTSRAATVNMPGAPDIDVDPRANDTPRYSPMNGKNKFLALVEKHRKQRQAMEAAEIVKRAARSERLEVATQKSRTQRRSSIADSSGDDTVLSDEDAGSRLAKEARPTRKASKRAIEEMNRETQRMSRNMQLAHQARTKKKVTKESLLARFNFPIAGPADTFNFGAKPSSASSAPTSDGEGVQEHVTPPTSPLVEAGVIKDISVQANVQDEEDLLDLNGLMTQPVAAIEQGACRAADIAPQAQQSPRVRPIRVKWTKEDAVMARAADSDSDLEIITSQSKTRKYAVFEAMPARKAHETESHLVLRNLAHIDGSQGDKKRSSMNGAEMEASLRRAARLQAQQERQERIEELTAKGIVIQTSEEREREQQEVEDLVEKARQEGAEIQKREKEAAKKAGTYVKDTMDDDDDDDEDDDDFEDHEDAVALSGSDAEQSGQGDLELPDGDEESEDESSQPDEVSDEREFGNEIGLLVDGAAEEQSQDASDEDSVESQDRIQDDDDIRIASAAIYKPRKNRLVIDDDDDDETAEMSIMTPAVPAPAKTPQSLVNSARKIIPGLQMSYDLPIGLTQAFAATMADSQTFPSSPGTEAQDSMAMMRILPSPNIPFMPQLHRLDSIDLISDSQPATQTQPLDLNFGDTQHISQSPAPGSGTDETLMIHSQMPFEPTQDAGYMLSPFAGSRFGAETPQQQRPHSTIDTVIVSDGSPLLQRRGRLRRGPAERTTSDGEGSDLVAVNDASAFDVMHHAARQKTAMPTFDKTKSYARDIVEEAAEESEDEYAGLGGASDDDVGEEDEEDRQMIDHDTQVGRGDEAKLAGLYADRERQHDEAAVSKLLKDITTGALRRKRGVGDDLELSDEEDDAARRREAKRREYAKMRRELFKDEAVEKIAEDKKKEAFLKSIEDRDEVEDDNGGSVEGESQQDDSQGRLTKDGNRSSNAAGSTQMPKRPLEFAHESSLNRLPTPLRRGPLKTGADKKPSTLAEIRDSVSFLIEEPNSQSMTIDLGPSDSEDEPEKYLDLDRHLNASDEIENDDEDLGDFIVDDSQKDDAAFKVPDLPAATRPPAAERRTKTRNFVNRLSLMRQSSSSSNSSGAGGKMAFFTTKSMSIDIQSSKVPSLLRRATTNSSFGSTAGREESASSVTVTKERGHAREEKAFIRKGTGSQRNAVNYRVKPAESKMSERAGVKKAIVGKAAKSKNGGFLGGLFRSDSWA